MLPDDPYLRARFFLLASAASLEAFAQCALANLAQAVTEYGFPTIHSAAVAVDMLRQDGGIVQLRP